MALPQLFRLKKSTDFKAVFKSGRYAAGDLTDLKIRASGFNFCRFGFIVSLKVSKKATARNRLRRQMAEIARKYALAAKKGYDILIIAKTGAANKSKEQISNDIEKNIKKIGVFV